MPQHPQCPTCGTHAMKTINPLLTTHLCDNGHYFNDIPLTWKDIRPTDAELAEQDLARMDHSGEAYKAFTRKSK